MANTSTVYERCVHLLAEDTEREARRRNLEDQKSRLLAGRKRLDALAEKYQRGVSPSTANGLSAQASGSLGHEDTDQKMRYA
jgi:hypothetical protein